MLSVLLRRALDTPRAIQLWCVRQIRAGKRHIFHLLRLKLRFVKLVLLRWHLKIHALADLLEQRKQRWLMQKWLHLLPGKFEPECGEADLHAYRQLLLRSKYVLSPPGNGPDCHRTWESIYLGAIPIVLAIGFGLILPNQLRRRRKALTV